MTLIGDSLTLGAAAELKNAIEATAGADTTRIDGTDNRQVTSGLDLIEQYHDRGLLGQRIVVQLGTNGSFSTADFDRMMTALRDVPQVFIVNVKVPRPWEQRDNVVLAAGATRYKNVTLINWHAYGSAHPEFFAPDGFHLNHNGAVAYATFIAKAILETPGPSDHKTFVLRSATFAPGQSWSLALHPNATPIRVVVTSSKLEACPANVQGVTWPGFHRCIKPNRAGNIVLPRTNGNFHVPFALRTRDNPVIATVTVKYQAVDSFFEVLPPIGTQATMQFTPRSSTIGVHAGRLPDDMATDDITIAIRQRGRQAFPKAPCDFANELSDCVSVISGHRVTLSIPNPAAAAGPIRIFLAWT